jgi:hypothetical protein
MNCKNDDQLIEQLWALRNDRNKALKLLIDCKRIKCSTCGNGMEKTLDSYLRFAEVYMAKKLDNGE